MALPFGIDHSLMIHYKIWKRAILKTFLSRVLTLPYPTGKDNETIQCHVSSFF